MFGCWTALFFSPKPCRGNQDRITLHGSTHWVVAVDWEREMSYYWHGEAGASGLRRKESWKDLFNDRKDSIIQEREEQAREHTAGSESRNVVHKARRSSPLHSVYLPSASWGDAFVAREIHRSHRDNKMEREHKPRFLFIDCNKNVSSLWMRGKHYLIRYCYLSHSFIHNWLFYWVPLKYYKTPLGSKSNGKDGGFNVRHIQVQIPALQPSCYMILGKSSKSQAL